MSDNEPISFMHLVRACRTDKERAEFSLLIAHAALGFSASADAGDKTTVPLRMTLACHEAAQALALEVLGSEKTKQ